MESRNMTEKEFEEFQKLLARELGAVDSDRDREEEKLITEMLRHEGAAHEAARTAANAVREFAVKRAAEEKETFNMKNSGDSDGAEPYREITEKTAVQTPDVSLNSDNISSDDVDIEEMLRHDPIVSEPIAETVVSQPAYQPEHEAVPEVESNHVEKPFSHEKEQTAATPVRGKYEKVVEEPLAQNILKTPNASEILKKHGKYEKITEEAEGYFNPEVKKESAFERRRRAKRNTKILRIAIGLSAVFVVSLSAGLIVNTIKANKNKPNNDLPASAVKTDVDGNTIDNTPSGSSNIVSITPLKNYTAVLIGNTLPLQISMATTGSVNSSDILWESSDTGIAKIDEDGVITGVSAGKCDITISAKSDPSINAHVSCTVRKAEKIGGVNYIDNIMIINKSYGADPSFDPGELNEEVQSAFSDLCAAAAEEDLNIYNASDYRSYSLQEEIYNDYVTQYGEEMADTFSARPGFSEHQSALVIDVNSIDDTFNDTPESKWLEKHCAEYGFIIRYPKGKENITGYKYESWHIRYVGKDIAKEITELGITLDEYLGVDSVYSDDDVSGNDAGINADDGSSAE